LVVLLQVDQPVPACPKEGLPKSNLLSAATSVMVGVTSKD